MVPDGLGLSAGHVWATHRWAVQVSHLWGRVPVVVRALVVALVVAVAGNGPWLVLFLLNLRVMPSLPWSVPVMAAYLWFYWRYLNGWGWPRSTAAARRRDLRAKPLSPRVWRWSLAALGLHMAAMTALELVARRFVDPTPYQGLPEIPPGVSALTIGGLLLMLSVVAGVVEEAAFRGYLQAPLERRHGPVAAVVMTSSVFALMHFNSYPGMSVGFLLAFVVGGSGFAIVAWLSGSIRPGIVLHAAVNAAALLGGWWAGGNLAVPPFAETGADVFFRVDCAEVLVFGAAAAWAYRGLARSGRA